MFFCSVVFLCSCENNIDSAPSNVSGKTFSINNTSVGTIKIRFTSNSSATITNSYGNVAFASISYNKTGAASAKIVIKDINIEIRTQKDGLIGRAYDTNNISLVFNSENQGVSSGYWDRRTIFGVTGSPSGTIDSSIFAVF